MSIYLGYKTLVATHSESVLSEAAEKSDIIAFVGKPHIVNNKSQLLKSLNILGFDQYLLAQQKGWVLYLEGSTDLAILKIFAKVLNHKVLRYIECPFVKYVGNIPAVAREHFYGLQEGVPDLKGVVLFDRIDKELKQNDFLTEVMWQRRGIENYLPLPSVVEGYVSQSSKGFQHNKELMRTIIEDEIPPAALKDKNHIWWINTKISEEFLDRIFEKYFRGIKTPILLSKRGYHVLATFSKPDELVPEVWEKLDVIYDIARKAE